MAIVILGMGKTGLSLAKYFYEMGEEVWGIDDHLPTENRSTPEKFYSHQLFLNGNLPPKEKIERFFISPGVDPQHPAAETARSRGLAIEGELDLAFSLCEGEILAITGTNGKSTTTALLGEVLKSAGIAVGVGGNLGTPFLDLINDSNNYSKYVIEVSSFQLESINLFHPKVGALLNLSDDHFDRHRNLNEYLQAKRKLFDFQTAQEFAVYNDDDLHVLEAAEGIPSKLIPFSTAKKVKGSYGEENSVFWAPEGNVESRFDLSQCSLTGLHNLENISAVVACAKCIGIADVPIQEAINRFIGLPHRLELVTEIEGVKYYDDSKATNVGAVVMSLASFEENVVLIMGGKDKGGDYSPLKPLLRHKTKCLIILGEAKEKIQKSLEGATEIIVVSNMEEAVSKAHEMAPPGGTVLLSPACSSFDMYSDYKERGEDFRKWVREIEKNS